MRERFFLCKVYDWWEMFWPPLATWGDLRRCANDDFIVGSPHEG